jgi:uncharacterized protein YbaP (TraB family)
MSKAALSSRLTVLLSLLCLCAGAKAQDAAASAPPDDALPTTVLDTVVVSGIQPGPGLWKVSHGEHVMWVLGTLSPLPRRMQWNSDEVEAVIARSQEVLTGPSANFRMEGGMLRNLFLIPSAMRARNNPGKEKLEDVLPPDLYQRWLALKQIYLGRDRTVEKRRPLMAAQQLQEEALDQVGLSLDTRIGKVVRKAAKRHDVPVTRPVIELAIADPKTALREFADTSLDDIECFRKTIEQLETDIETMKLRANAWALGEIAILRRLPTTDNTRACTQSVLQTRIAKRLGFDDLEARAREVWLTAADTALARNASTFATLPMGLVMREDGYMAALVARGYQVQAPDEAASETDAAATLSVR